MNIYQLFLSPNKIPRQTFHLLAIICLLLIGSWGNILLAQLPRHIQEDYQLIWQDEFNGPTLDTSKWAYRGTGSTRGNGIVSAKNCYLDKQGHLIIEATKTDTNYVIGQIGTMNKFHQTYGYFECRAKTSSQIGTCAAFWLQSSTYGSIIGDPGQSGTEIDIMEYRHANNKELVHHTIHWDGYGKDHRQEGSRERVKNFDKDFHTFGLEWTEKKYIFYIDGKRVWSTRKAVSQTMQYIILSLEMTNWCGDPSNSVFPDRVLFDYVRVYEMKGE